MDGNTEAPREAKPKLGLMTSLPLYWPLGVDMAALASGDAEVPWQRVALEREFDLVPLDTLSPITGLTDEAPEMDPLAGIDHLAVIQPRGLSPADNVALDDWVRDGGQLLLVLDPMLTGEYALPLGDPRRPTDMALIPPVVKRWNLFVGFDDWQSSQVASVALDEGIVLRSMAGEIRRELDDSPACEYAGDGMIARCSVGKGQVTLVADAASFEHRPEEAEVVGQGVDAIAALVDYAFGGGERVDP